MPLFPVTTYGVGWNPVTRQGRVFMQIGSSPAVPVPIASPEELIILLLVLSKTGVQFDPQTREIELPFRPVGT